MHGGEGSFIILSNAKRERAVHISIDGWREAAGETKIIDKFSIIKT